MRRVRREWSAVLTKMMWRTPCAVHHCRSTSPSAVVPLTLAGMSSTEVIPSARSCRVAMVWCHEAGTVIEVLPGEVQFKHPHRDAMLRGKMIELKLSDPAAGQDETLFAGGKPLLF